MVYIDLDIEGEEEISNENLKKISVSQILKERSLEGIEASMSFDFYVATKVCEDVLFASHSLNLVATVDLKKVLSVIRPHL
jgi:hypothetical protein